MKVSRATQLLSNSVSAAIGMLYDLKLLGDDDNLQFIFLGKLNQDGLENFFYKIRASQGINMHPSAHEIQNNCEDDDDVFLEWNEDINDHPTKPTEKDPLQSNLDEHLAEDEDFVGKDKESAELAVEEDLLTDIPDELYMDEVPEKPAEL
ncbi:unnamed protein product [Ceratitis capitata]|uniref:(Mediterranean fruit fly) hypothetical protein n=1 Tax=Ceratitis capitata TaxID=7213 RepID=A0A811UZ40_CERCA|nr:unnamed protein product [Ceratitis capitata]